MNHWSQNLESQFKQAQTFLFAKLLDGEDLRLRLRAEDSTFVRWNGGKVRQNTEVNQAALGMTLAQGKHRVSGQIGLTLDFEHDRTQMLDLLKQLRLEMTWAPAHPTESPLGNGITSSHHAQPHAMNLEQVIEEIAVICREMKLDLAGHFIWGDQATGVAHSKGQSHFHSQKSFSFDYSLYAVNSTGENKAVKASYAGQEWDFSYFQRKLMKEAEELRALLKAPHEIVPGDYRVYLSPSAVAELMKMWSWGGLSERAHRMGFSNFSPWIKGEKKLSEKLIVAENFALESCPRFNSLGEIPQEKLVLVNQGKVENTLISTPTAMEFGLVSNQAEPGENFRSLEMAGGQLKGSQILASLDRGLWISELHYINWSDQKSARVTGMTRFGCFWVENGQIQAPIRDLRFDVSFYDIFGGSLVDLTTEQELHPNLDTYFWRGLGAAKTPGALIRDFHFSL